MAGDARHVLRGARSSPAFCVLPAALDTSLSPWEKTPGQGRRAELPRTRAAPSPLRRAPRIALGNENTPLVSQRWSRINVRLRVSVRRYGRLSSSSPSFIAHYGVPLFWYSFSSHCHSRLVLTPQGGILRCQKVLGKGPETPVTLPRRRPLLWKSGDENSGTRTAAPLSFPSPPCPSVPRASQPWS